MMYITWPPIVYYTITVIDILVVAYVIYNLLNFFMPGNVLLFTVIVGIFIVVLFIAQLFKMQLTLWLIQKILLVLPFAILILFQQEIKQFLTHKLGQEMQKLFLHKKDSVQDAGKQQILKALQYLSKRKIGAIIVMENNSSLAIIKSKSIELYSEITAPVLISIFNTSSPLHDGAVIISENKIAVASAFLPITEKENALNLGSRHRASIGITETTDALSLVVSEQTGAISYCKAGTLYYDVGLSGVQEILEENSEEDPDEDSIN